MTPGRMQKNLGFETEIAQCARQRTIHNDILLFHAFCMYWPSGRIHAVGHITRLYGIVLNIIFANPNLIQGYQPVLKQFLTRIKFVINTFETHNNRIMHNNKNFLQ